MPRSVRPLSGRAESAVQRLTDPSGTQLLSVGTASVAAEGKTTIHHDRGNGRDSVLTCLISALVPEVMHGDLAVGTGQLLNELDGGLADRATCGEHFYLAFCHFEHLHAPP